MRSNKKVQVGDIFQILSSAGVCYGQVTHHHPEWRFVVSIFREFFETQPKDFSKVVDQEPQYITVFPIQSAVRQGFFTIVGNVPVAESLRPFPTFRGTNQHRGDETVWFLNDGQREWRLDRPLTDKEKKYPIGPSIPSAPLLIERIEKNYGVTDEQIMD